VVVVKETIAFALVVPGVFTGRFRGMVMTAVPTPFSTAWFVMVLVEAVISLADIETMPIAPVIWNPVNAITTDVPVNAGKGLKEGVRIMVELDTEGVTRVWVGDVPMLNLAGLPVMVNPGKVMVIAVILAVLMAEKVTMSVWHDIPQPSEVTDFTANPDR